MQWPESRAAVEVGRYRQRRARLPSRIRSARPPLGRPRAAPFESTPGLGERRLLFVRGVARMADRYHTQHGEGEGQGRSCTRASATHLRCSGPRSVVVQQGEGTHPCCHARDEAELLASPALDWRAPLADTPSPVMMPVFAEIDRMRNARLSSTPNATIPGTITRPGSPHHSLRIDRPDATPRRTPLRTEGAPWKHRRLADAERVGALVRSKCPHLFSTALPFILF